MRGFKVITEEHQRIIKDMWYDHTNQEIANVIGCHKQSVSYWSRRLGLPDKRKGVLSGDPRFAENYKKWQRNVSEGLSKAYAYERARVTFNVDRETRLNVSPWFNNPAMRLSAYRLRTRGYTLTPGTKVFWYDENTNRTQRERILTRNHNFIFKSKI